MQNNSYATMATEIDASVTDICSQARKVRSLAKNTFGSTLTGSCNGKKLVLVYNILSCLI